MTSFAERLFVAIGRTASRLPPVRGKTRICLGLYRLLGLDKHHVRVQANLRRPVRYAAELDLHAWAQRVAFLTGGYEEDTVAFLLRLHAAAPARGFLLDIGANVGLIAAPFALAGSAKVVAVEAVPDNVTALRNNIALNQLQDAVTVIPFGVGDASRVVEIQVEGDLHAGEGTGTANILPSDSTYACVRQTLEIRTLDELTASGAIPAGCAVMKVDTDGYDLKVLQGGVQFLARERPVIFGEFSAHCMRWHDQTLADVLAFARAAGYEVWKRIHPGWTFEPATETASFDQDLLLVPRERAGDYGFCIARTSGGSAA